MKKNLSFLILLFYLAARPAPGFGASEPVPASPVELASYLALAYERNPEISAAHARWQAAKKSVLAAWALKDPMIGMDIMGADRETANGPEMNRFVVEQEIPFPLKLWKRRAAARAMEKAERERYFAVRRVVANKLRNAWYELNGVDESLKGIDEIKAVLEKFQKVAQARYANRSGSQRDVAKAQAEVALALEQELMLRQRREALAAALNALVDRDPLETIPAFAVPEKPQVHQEFRELLAKATERRAELLAVEAEVHKSLEERALAWMENLPDLKAGFEYTWVESPMNGGMADKPGQDQWMFPLRINVPLWQNRIIPEIQAAHQRTAEAKAEAGVVRNQIFYELREAFVRFDTSRQVVLLYETAVLPQARLALASDDAGYESGGVMFLDLLDSERTYLNARLAYARLYSEMMRAYADLELAAGTELEGGKP